MPLASSRPPAAFVADLLRISGIEPEEEKPEFWRMSVKTTGDDKSLLLAVSVVASLSNTSTPESSPDVRLMLSQGRWTAIGPL